MAVLGRVLGASITAFAVLAVTTACGSEAEPAASSTASSSSTSSATSSAPASTSAAATPAAGATTTLTDYFASAGITETVVKKGDPGAPTIDFPIPPGWADAGPATPPEAWQRLTVTDPAFASDPASATFLVTKLTGAPVDEATIFELAPNDQRGLPDFVDLSSSDRGTLSGFPSLDFGGTYTRDGATRLVGQKTVLIPANGGGSFLLKIVVDANEEQFGPLADLTTMIDDQTTIAS